MSVYSPASEVILRHADEFKSSHVLFAGDLQDDLPIHFQAAEINVHCTQYHHWRRLQQGLDEQHVEFSVVPSHEIVHKCDTLIYYWPKSKQEAQFQLSAILSQLHHGAHLFIVGENRSGVRSAESLLTPFCELKKIDSARRCGLYYGLLEEKPTFNIDDWWHQYNVAGLTIKTLPGVFSYSGLDKGSELLLSAIGDKPLTGTLLDIGCGSGVLATVLKASRPNLVLTLTDVNSAALFSSKATLAANQLTGKVIASDVFSNIEGTFDVIISNPPFHDSRLTDLRVATALIEQAKHHLAIEGKLYIVANSFLPYGALLDRAFGAHDVIAETGRFKVYVSHFHPSLLRNKTF